MRLKGIRSATLTLAAFVVAGLAMSACGELTGPKSPSTPTDVVATLVSNTSATITWKPSPLNDGVISYTIFRNGNKVGESTTTSYTDTGLAQNTTYVYSVAANCKGGIVSDPSVETAAATITTIDTTPPRVVSTIPVNGATGVSRAGTATVTFSEPIDPATLTTSTFNIRVTSSGQVLPGRVTYTVATRVAEFIPTNPMPNLTSMTVTVTTGVKDLSGNAMAAPFTSVWTTRDEDGPTVTSSTPANGASGVSATAPITVTFSEAVTAGTVNSTNILLKLTSTGATVPGTLAFNGTTLVTFTPSAPLTQGANYTFSVNAVTDLAGNAMPGPFILTFTVGDITAPTVVSTVPADLATNVSPTAAITVTFSEAMDQATVNATTFFVRPTAGGSNVAGVITYNATTNTATFTPSSALAGGTAYTATVTTGAKDLAGNALAATKTWTFATTDSTPPTITSVVPANNATGVATNATVQVTFSEPMDSATMTTTNITLKNTSTTVAVTATVSYNTATKVATLTPSGPLSNATNYTLTVTTGVKDVAGNALVSQFTSNFTTTAVTDNTPPTIISRSPAPNALGVATNTTVTVGFSEPMDPLTITTTTVKLAPTSSGTPVAAVVTYDAGTNSAILTPSSPLLNNTGYTVTVTTGVKDVAGNALATQSTWTFTTIADTTAPTILSTSPVNGTTVPAPATITVTFSEDMDNTTINGTTFTVKKTSDSSPVAGVVSYNTSTKTAIFTPSSALAAGTGYTVTVTTGAKDLAGNGLTGNFTFSFTTSP
jgi:methionine-rich copper-binding protein CopC